MKYNDFELKNIAFDEKKFPMLFLVIQKSLNKRRIGTVALILGRCLLTFLVPNAVVIRGRHLFGGGAYSSKCGNTHLRLPA